MDIQKLKYFCCVAKQLNFSKAAEECHMAQTAMSRCIAKLEDELGFRLFDRTHHKVELTSAGRYFLPEATKIVEEYEFAMRSGKEIAKTTTARLDVGFCGYDMGFSRFYVGRFLKANPQCSLILREYAYDDIIGSLLSGTSDIIFTSQLRTENKESLQEVVISDSEYVVSVGPSHPLAGYTEVYPSQLNGENFISPSDTNMIWDPKSHLDSIFTYYGISPGCVTRTNSAVSVITMVEMGLGISFLSRDIELSNPNIRILRLRHDHPATKRHVVACFSPVKRPIIRQFMEFAAATPFRRNDNCTL